MVEEKGAVAYPIFRFFFSNSTFFWKGILLLVRSELAPRNTSKKEQKNTKISRLPTLSLSRSPTNSFWHEAQANKERRATVDEEGVSNKRVLRCAIGVLLLGTPLFLVVVVWWCCGVVFLYYLICWGQFVIIHAPIIPWNTVQHTIGFFNTLPPNIQLVTSFYYAAGENSYEFIWHSIGW